MINFLNMEIVFNVVEDTSYKKGKFHFNREGFNFKVCRYLSGAAAYGDRSGHSVEILNHPEYMMKIYDTRYDGIKSDKVEWIAFWKDFIEYTWGLKVEPDIKTYKEQKEAI